MKTRLWLVSAACLVACATLLASCNPSPVQQSSTTPPFASTSSSNTTSVSAGTTAPPATTAAASKTTSAATTAQTVLVPVTPSISILPITTSKTVVLPLTVTASIKPPTIPDFTAVVPIFTVLSKPSVWSWGNNQFGGLGNNGGSATNLPQQIQGLNDVQAMAGFDHVLAVKSDGTVWGWGENTRSQLGGAAPSGSSVFVPKQIPGLSNIKAVAAGISHSLALDSNGEVWSWGYNSVGQLGHSSIGDIQISTPLKVTGLSGVVAIAAGYCHNLALKNDGSVWAWGYNYHGELGIGTTQNSGTPVKVLNLFSIVGVVASWNHSLALRSDGRVFSWGDNQYGTVGDGSTTNVAIPVLLSNLQGIKSVAAGWSHSLALATDGTLWVWGGNNSGQLGIGTTATVPLASPVKGPTLAGISRIAAGSDSSFAIKTDGTLWAWGGNANGQLGIGNNNDSTIPVQVSTLSRVEVVVTGRYQSGNGSAFCLAICQ